MKIKLFVATHKEYEFPQEEMYVPIQVGCSLRDTDFGYLKDNSCKDNISDKNTSFCELTALYEIWKSECYSDLDYVGLSHYRRYFSGKTLLFKEKRILDEAEAVSLLNRYDVIVPKKRNYYIESVSKHYTNAHNIKDLDAVKRIIEDKYPEYLEGYDVVMRGKTLHLFNMFVIKKTLFDSYMSWLFDILFELEKRIDTSTYDNYQARVFGFMSERLFNVWLEKQQLNVVELSVVNIEGENLLLKAIGLLKRKFFK